MSDGQVGGAVCVFHGGSGFVTTETQQKPTCGEEPFISTKGLELV